MTELETKEAIEEQERLGIHFAQGECLKQIAINIARIVDRLDVMEHTLWKLFE